jgi:hypothetical protein
MSGSNTVPTGLSAGTDIECGGSAPAPLACGQAGVYGTILTAAAGNVPGGRDSAVSWSDRDGNLWLFAGEGFDAVDKWGSLNDLWELAPSSDEWAWMGGDYVANGNPQFGTLGIPSVGNTPLGGYGMSSWVDAGGNIWTFGGNTGTDYETGYDLLWEFDIPTDEWALMNGGSTDGLPVYGTLGAPAPANIPGPRYGAVNWTDKAGNLWIFGGAGFAESGWSYLNDLWEILALGASAGAVLRGICLAWIGQRVAGRKRDCGSHNHRCGWV